MKKHLKINWEKLSIRVILVQSGSWEYGRLASLKSLSVCNSPPMALSGHCLGSLTPLQIAPSVFLLPSQSEYPSNLISQACDFFHKFLSQAFTIYF